MTDAEIIKTIAEKVMGWKLTKNAFCGCVWGTQPLRYVGEWCLLQIHPEIPWNPLTSWADCMDAEAAIIASGNRLSYVNSMWAKLPIGPGNPSDSLGLLHADKRTRCLAMVEAVRGGK